MSNSSSRTARPLLHAASGAPTALFPHTQADMVRIGGLLFGILPAAGGVSLVRSTSIVSQGCGNEPPLNEGTCPHE